MVRRAALQHPLPRQTVPESAMNILKTLWKATDIFLAM